MGKSGGPWTMGIPLALPVATAVVQMLAWSVPAREDVILRAVSGAVFGLVVGAVGAALFLGLGFVLCCVVRDYARADGSDAGILWRSAWAVAGAVGGTVVGLLCETARAGVRERSRID